MTKIVKFWMKFSFWAKLKSIFAALGIGGEFALFLGDSHENYKWIVGGATVLAIIITHVMEDKNNNNISDIFE